MARQPKYKICRRLGNSVFEKCQTQKFTASEMKRSNSTQKKRRSMPSDYGMKLLEKQKLKLSYGLKEKNLVKYVKEAILKGRGDSAGLLFSSLESRLDNVVYRLGLVSTRAMARQTVSHGHIMVNGRKVNIPSYKTRKGDKVSIREQSTDKGMFAKTKEQMKSYKIPAWLKFDEKKKEYLVETTPEFSETGIDLKLIIEFYNR